MKRLCCSSWYLDLLRGVTAEDGRMVSMCLVVFSSAAAASSVVRISLKMTVGLWRFEPTDVEFLTAAAAVGPPEVHKKLILAMGVFRGAGLSFLFCFGRRG